jgi:hypothetical protein
MTKYIDTWQGRWAVKTSSTIGPGDDVLFLGLAIMPFLADAEHRENEFRGCTKLIMCHDENEFIEQLKSQFAAQEDDNANHVGQGPLLFG